ncbi:MAG: transposase [Deltaproteobacteria bacterium]|nr:transposase [Deltaproteobacteria bacterium]
MTHRLRFAPPGPTGEILTEVTLRCIQGRYLLRPSKRLNSLVIGVLARAQAAFQVRVHACSFMTNHAHLLLSVASQKDLSSFMNFVGSNIAREVNLLQEWDGKVWARRYSSIPVVGGESIEVAHLEYLLSQGTKEGLVDSPLRWPGINAAEALSNGRNLQGIWVNRTALNKARRRHPKKQIRSIEFEERLTLVLSPLPCWEDLPAAEHQVRIRGLVRQIEDSARQARKGAAVAGTQAVLRQDPHTRLPRLVTSPAPIVHASSRKVRLAFLEAYRLFVRAFRAAVERQRDGDLTVEFPVGSFPPARPFVEAIQGLKPG